MEGPKAGNPAAWVLAFWISLLGVALLLWFSRPSCAFYQSVVWVVQLVLGLLVLATVLWSLRALQKSTLSRPLRAVLLGFWLVTPPLWFSLEYFALYRPIWQKSATQLEERRACGVGWEEFKYGQEISAQLWAGIVAFLAALYFKDAPGNAKRVLPAASAGPTPPTRAKDTSPKG